MKELQTFFMSEKWVDTVEQGTNDQFESELAVAIDPLTRKIMNISGDNFVHTMSHEMG